MKFESEKTAEPLRAQAMAADVEQRLRVMQRHSHGYGHGSEAAIASLLLATFGGCTTMGENVAAEDGKPWLYGTVAMTAVKQVAEPMQACANDMSYAPEDEFNAS